MCIDAGILQALSRLLAHPKKAIRKEVCWSVSNITAGNVKQIQMTIENNIVDQLLQILQFDDNEVKKEAVWALSNIT